MNQENLISWTKTNQMRDMLVFDGHMYQFCKPNVTDDYYRCCMSRVRQPKTKCQSSLNLSKDRKRVTREPTVHNHPIQLQAVPIVKRLRNNIKVRVKEQPMMKPHKILAEEISKACTEEGLEMSAETSQLIPDFKKFSRTLYSIRAKDKIREPKETENIKADN